MKRLFMREYRAAEAQGERNPKVLVKLGHWHVFRGQGPSHLQTLGNFVTEFATANGADAFSVGVYLRGPWRDVKTQKGLEPIALGTDSAGWTIIDFRSLRPAVAGRRFGRLNPSLLAHIYGFDAALVLQLPPSNRTGQQVEFALLNSLGDRIRRARCGARSL